MLLQRDGRQWRHTSIAVVPAVGKPWHRIHRQEPWWTLTHACPWPRWLLCCGKCDRLFLAKSLTLVITPHIVSGSIFGGSFRASKQLSCPYLTQRVSEECCSGMQLSLYFAHCGHRCIQSTNHKSQSFWQKYARMLTFADIICFYLDAPPGFCQVPRVCKVTFFLKDWSSEWKIS